MIPAIQEEELFRACRVLFGDGLSLSRDFLDYIQWSGVKRAYRRKVHEYHPDKASGASDDFIALQQAYEELSEFLTAREKGFRLRRNGAARRESRPVRPRREPAACRSAAEKKKNCDNNGGKNGVRFRYTGGLPRRRLLLGHYLYYSGLIDWRTIIRALVWQRNNRPRLGEIGRQLGWLKQADIKRIMAARNSMEPFGRAAIKLGILSESQVGDLLRRQQRQQRRFGDYFVAVGMFSRGEMEGFVAGMKSHNAALREERYSGERR